MNVFKRKTKVIDDEDNMDIETAEITNKKVENFHVNPSNIKKLEENKSGNNIHTIQIKNNNLTRTEHSSKEKNEFINSNEVKKAFKQENFNKSKEIEIKGAIKNSVDRNNINSVKPSPLDKIKKSIVISSSSDKKTSVPNEKQVMILNFN